MRISSASVEYVRVPISAREAGSAVDPTADTVTMAFTAGTTPTTWIAATWETDTTTTPTTYYARTLVGPGNTVLAAGTWTVWVKVTDSPEVPVLQAPVALTVY